jgi:protease-4
MRKVVQLFFLAAGMFFASFCAGCGAPSFLVTPVSSSHALDEETVQPGSGLFAPKIAIIGVEGMLMDAKKGGLLQPTENVLSLFTQELQKAADDPSVKAVVLRVNSPGGTVTTSDTMYEEIVRFKKKTGKPVIASTQEMAASGAYYVCCAADRIVAHPTSLVGSIGVIFNRFDVADLLKDHGILVDAIHSGTLKDMGSPFKHATPQEELVMREMVQEYFGRFESIVKDNRPIKETPPAPDQKLSPDYAGIFSGRVFSGTEAVRLGLADQTGLLQDALDLARKMAHAPNASAIMYHRPYGYGGSIYAETQNPVPQSNVFQFNLPESRAFLPVGFYYVWEPS